jgi:hypothetical protein
VLGDLIVAGAALATAGVAFPKTTAAEAVLAATDVTVPAPLIARARERALRLRVRRLASLLTVFSGKDVHAIGRALEHVRDEVTAIAAWGAETFSAFSPFALPDDGPDDATRDVSRLDDEVMRA